MGGLKSFAKSTKRFLKKNTKEIATVIGFMIGGPGGGAAAGAAIGRGIGGLAEGEDIAEAAMAGAQIYAGGKMLGGAGFGYDPNAALGSGKFYNAANAGVSGTGIGGFFEGVGANTASALGAKVPGASKLASIGDSYEALNFLEKGAVLATAASGANSLSGGKLFAGEDEPSVMSGPLDQSGYLTKGLTPAQLSDVYSTKGSGTGITGSMPSLEQSYDYDPVNSSIAELLRQQEEYELEFPEFARIGMNRGGALGMSPAIQMGTDIQQLQPIMNDVSRPAPPMQIQPFPSLSRPFQQRRGAQGDVMSALRPVGDFIKGRLNTDEVDSTLQEFAQTIESKFPDNKGGGMQGGFQNMYGGPGQGNGIGQLRQVSNTDQGMDRDNFNIQSNDAARLADGGQMPTQDLDLREHGGDIDDPEGSGDEDTVPALLADGEFVMTKQAVAGIGDGDHDKGIAQLYAMMGMNENKAQTMGIGRA